MTKVGKLQVSTLAKLLSRHDLPEPLRRALVEANAEEPLEVLGHTYDGGQTGYTEHSGSVFVINRKFVYESEHEQSGLIEHNFQAFDDFPVATRTLNCPLHTPSFSEQRF